MKHLPRSVPALLLAFALVLMITGCDSLVETESTDVVHAGDVIADQAAFVKTGRTSTLDGKPILRLSEEELYSGRYTAHIHKFIRLHGAQLLSELQNESIQGLSGDIQILNQAGAEADFSTGVSVPLAELFNRIDRKLLANESSEGLEEPQAPSTHLEVVTNEETAEVYLTLSLLLTEEMRRSTAEEGRSFSFTDCSTIIIPTPECPEEIRFVSIDDPDDLIDVPDPGHVFVTATDIMDP